MDGVMYKEKQSRHLFLEVLSMHFVVIVLSFGLAITSVLVSCQVQQFDETSRRLSYSYSKCWVVPVCINIILIVYNTCNNYRHRTFFEDKDENSSVVFYFILLPLTMFTWVYVVLEALNNCFLCKENCLWWAVYAAFLVVVLKSLADSTRWQEYGEKWKINYVNFTTNFLTIANLGNFVLYHFSTRQFKLLLGDLSINITVPACNVSNTFGRVLHAFYSPYENVLIDIAMLFSVVAILFLIQPLARHFRHIQNYRIDFSYVCHSYYTNRIPVCVKVMVYAVIVLSIGIMIITLLSVQIVCRSCIISGSFITAGAVAIILLLIQLKLQANTSMKIDESPWKQALFCVVLSGQVLVYVLEVLILVNNVKSDSKYVLTIVDQSVTVFTCILQSLCLSIVAHKQIDERKTTFWMFSDVYLIAYNIFLLPRPFELLSHNQIEVLCLNTTKAFMKGLTTPLTAFFRIFSLFVLVREFNALTS